jgi:hypothetical protein
MNVEKVLTDLVRRVELQYGGVYNVRDRLLSISRKGGDKTDVQNCNM